MSISKIKRICIICARGGSKGLPNKNIMLLDEKPLITYSIEYAINAGIFDVVAVSSDSCKILRIAEEAGAETITRPDELARDNTPSSPVFVHAVEEMQERMGYEFDTLVVLQPTSPLRLQDDISMAVSALEDKSLDSILSVQLSKKSPYLTILEVDSSGRVGVCKQMRKKITRRQDVPETYDMNGSIYVWNCKNYMQKQSNIMEKTALLLMPAARSIDIDDVLDFKMVEVLKESGIYKEGESIIITP